MGIIRAGRTIPHALLALLIALTVVMSLFTGGANAAPAPTHDAGARNGRFHTWFEDTWLGEYNAGDRICEKYVVRGWTLCLPASFDQDKQSVVSERSEGAGESCRRTFVGRWISWRTFDQTSLTCTFKGALEDAHEPVGGVIDYDRAVSVQ
jgi:hypothetical protein